MSWESVFRLCHVCGHVSEGEKEILRCGGCSKPYLPFSSLEKVMLAAGLHKSPTPVPQPPSPSSPVPQTAKTEEAPKPERQPNEEFLSRFVIQGLVVFW